MAAVEMFADLGPRHMYGLLGGHLEPDTTDYLSVEVRVSTANERLFNDSLAMKRDEVRVGLPAEYVQGVMAGLDLAKHELNTLTPGKLTINCAAHGAIGSCAALYKHLTVVLIKLFNADHPKLPDDELTKLFPQILS
jgi:hypothetical protein